MTEIVQGTDLVTLINAFTVAPERQRELLDVLVEATEAVMRTLPGFVSANLHASLDGTRVVNYAQWRSRADFEAMLENPAAVPHMTRATEIAMAVEPRLYEVAFVDHPSARSGSGR